MVAERRDGFEGEERTGQDRTGQGYVRVVHLSLIL